MKVFTKNQFMSQICFMLFVGFTPTILCSQNYRTIDAYLEDFGKNEMFIKKALMDYTITIVESQLDSRSKVTAVRIVEKIGTINSLLKKTDVGFNGNTSLRDSFIKMNEKTLQSLTNGSLILTDYDKQSKLPLNELMESLNRKEADLLGYYESIRNFEMEKKYFAKSYKLHFKKRRGKDILEYNAFQNMMFYKLNVMNEKLSNTISQMDEDEFEGSMKTFSLMYQQMIDKTSQLKSYFKDNSLNQASIDYANFIKSESEKLTTLFEEYHKAYEALQEMKNSTIPQNIEFTAIYNQTVRDYNNKKNSFYKSFNEMQQKKEALYKKWLVVNAAFLKKNGEFENIHQRYVFTD